MKVSRIFTLLFLCLCITFSCKKKEDIRITETSLYGTSWKGKLYQGLENRLTNGLFLYFDNDGKSTYIETNIDTNEPELYINMLGYKSKGNTIVWDKYNGRFNNLQETIWFIKRFTKDKLVLINKEGLDYQTVMEFERI